MSTAIRNTISIGFQTTNLQTLWTRWTIQLGKRQVFGLEIIENLKPKVNFSLRAEFS